MPASISRAHNVYNGIAIAVKHYVEDESNTEITPEFKRFVLELCKVLKSDNSYFDVARFLEASHVEP